MRLLHPLLDLFLRPNCPLCDRPVTTDELCTSCQRRLKECQQRNPYREWRSPLPVFAWGTYSGTLKRAIAALKYENTPQLARPLGYAMAEAWQPQKLSQKRPIVVPIPMHPAKQRQRGFNQAERLAEHFCQMTRLPLQAQGLQRVRNTQALFELNPQQRQQTLKNAIALGKPFQRRPPQHPVLLFDDIYTTGSTVREAIRILHQHRIAVCGVAVLARPPARTAQAEV